MRRGPEQPGEQPGPPQIRKLQGTDSGSESKFTSSYFIASGDASVTTSILPRHNAPVLRSCFIKPQKKTTRLSGFKSMVHFAETACQWAFSGRPGPGGRDGMVF